eukprot:TRINITY_DN4220_c0_g1_i2.p1 TRINITY_DN4220_c0_g1~~TRINITY_DN4220_c0_g1_i2.p1  ORF type:complete len:606 (-),score=128.93 TRINITY_DN4220_c0_g1_i2:285-2102(-)
MGQTQSALELETPSQAPKQDTNTSMVDADLKMTGLFQHHGTGDKAVVVLGKQLLEDGSPSAILANRMGVACEVFRNHCGPNDIMIVTGGKPGGGLRSEAEVMRDLALGDELGERVTVDFGQAGGKSMCDFSGVRADQVLVEDKARSTIENAFLIRELIEARGVSEVLLVTDDFHMDRAKFVFQSVMNFELGERELAGLNKVLQPTLQGRQLAFKRNALCKTAIVAISCTAPMPPEAKQAELRFEASFTQEKLMGLINQVLRGIPEKLGDNQAVHERACAEFESDLMSTTADSEDDSLMEPPTSFPKMNLGFEIGGAAEFNAVFEELEFLGRGQYGTVRTVRHRHTGTLYAVKHLPLEPGVAKERSEAKLLAQMAHDNIASLQALFETDTEQLLVMELCDLGTLPQMCSKHLPRRSPGVHEEYIEIMYGLASALAYCHDSGYAHCDVKPDNIMFVAPVESQEPHHPTLKLIDFGNARRVEGSADLCAQDVWFAGLIFFQLVTRQSFFIQDEEELQHLDEQGVYVDAIAMKCGKDYLTMRMEIAARCCGPEGHHALDLLRQMLELDVAHRIRAGAILEHPVMRAFPQKLFDKAGADFAEGAECCVSV